jgi:hypothetical protein
MSRSFIFTAGHPASPEAFVVGPATKIVAFLHFLQLNGCAASIRGAINYFEKFSAMLAGAQNFGSDAGNLVFS